jgi:hypothetical protein
VFSGDYGEKITATAYSSPQPSPPGRNEFLGAGVFGGGDAVVAVGVGDDLELGEGRLRFVEGQPAVIRIGERKPLSPGGLSTKSAIRSTTDIGAS